MERKISSVLVADMVGFSRLMEVDELDTLTRQKRYFSEVFSPELSRHKGRIVKTTGDGFLAEFSSVVEAVACAVDIQRTMAEREAEAAEDRRLVYRIGVNLGDVIHDEGDIFGDGVNVAARLEQLAEPGGVCISGSAFDHLRSTVEAGYEDMGEVQVKNFSRAVRAWRVLLDPDQAGQVISTDRAEPSAETKTILAELEEQYGSLARALDEIKESNRNQLEAIAARFEIANVFQLSDRRLRLEIFQKAEHFRHYQALIQNIDGTSSSLAGLKEQASAAAEALDFDTVEDLLSRVMETEVAKAAETAELRAQNALLRGRVDQALVLLSSAADSFAPMDPLEPARRRIKYDIWFSNHSNRFGGQGLEHSERLSRAAISALDLSAPLLLWQAHIGCGISLASQGKLAQPPRDLELLLAAKDHYRTALDVIRAQDFPVQRATTQNNLAVVLLNMAKRPEESEKQVLLTEAIAYLEDALAVHTRAAFPLKWAMAQDNLGNAFGLKGRFGTGPQAQEALLRAVRAHQDALTVYERETYPLRWAHTSGNMGLVWTDLSLHDACADPAQAHRAAEQHFIAALEVLTREEEPFHHARVLANLATLYETWLRHPCCEDRESLRTRTIALTKEARDLFIEFDAGKFAKMSNAALDRLEA